MKLPICLPLFLLIATFIVGGYARRKNKSKVEWPASGVKICKELVSEDLVQPCVTCFKNAGKNFKQIKACVSKWMPETIAGCSKTNTQATFNRCVKEEIGKQDTINRRTKVLYTKGGKVMNTVAGYKYLKDGPAAIFSIFSQDLVITDKPIQKLLETSSCSKRFQVDDENDKWHIHSNERPKLRKKQEGGDASERNMVYQYGAMGHDMPFHGVGPLAVDVLKGECIIEQLKKTGSLQEFVDAALNSQSSLPAWIFQEVVNNIATIKLP